MINKLAAGELLHSGIKKGFGRYTVIGAPIRAGFNQ